MRYQIVVTNRSSNIQLLFNSKFSNSKSCLARQL